MSHLVIDRAFGLNWILRATAAVWLIVAGSGSFAAGPPVTEELLTPLTSAYMRAVKPGEQAELHRELFQAVLQRVERSYPGDVDVRGLVAEALKTIEPLAPQSGEPVEVFRKSINAALASLDPHTYYFDSRELITERRSMSGSYVGLGFEVDMMDGLLRVGTPLPGTPAARAGLQRGDLVVRLDDQPVKGLALTDALSRMRGEPGTPIVLTLQRAGRGDEFNVSLVREVIGTQVVRWSREGEVLVLRLESFMGRVSEAMEKAIAEAVAVWQPRGVVLDLRGNLGGVLGAAVKTADAFLSEGEIVSMRGRDPARWRTWQADPDELLAGVPMVVLIDGGTASVSELVTAALQENGRATVMGQRSFGKGSIQSIDSLGPDRGALYITTALYYGPSGRTVQRTGVGPDVELVPSSRNNAWEWRHESDRANALPGGEEPAPPRARVDESRCAAARANVDPALACALVFLESGGIDAILATQK